LWLLACGMNWRETPNKKRKQQRECGKYMFVHFECRRSHLGKVNWLLLAFAVANVVWQSLVTRKVMDLPTAKNLHQFGFFSTICLVRYLCLCVCVVCFFCGSALYLSLVQRRFVYSKAEGFLSNNSGHLTILLWLLLLITNEKFTVSHETKIEFNILFYKFGSEKERTGYVYKKVEESYLGRW